MPNSPVRTVLEHLCRTMLPPDAGDQTDGQLLQGFIEHQDDASFAALVRRHGRMVWGVCRRVLGHAQDAEDAFQATFLVLVRKAASIVPREAVGNWLYGVAYHTALKARVLNLKRQGKEKQVSAVPEPHAVPADLWEELRPLLDQELSRLPDHYRSVIIHCDLEGKTRREVAQQLRIPEGTISSRLTTARRMLAKRLARRGLVVFSTGLAGVLAREAASACVPTALVRSTIEAASLYAAGPTAAGTVSPPVAVLTEGVLRSMLLDKLKTAAALVCMFVFGCLTLVLALDGAAADKPRETGGNKPAAADRLEGLWQDLASTDEARASRALLALAATPRESTALFKERLPAVKADPARVSQLVAELGDAKFSRRQAAAKELQYLGKFARPLLEKHLAGKLPLETQTRIQRLLQLLPGEARQKRPVPALRGQSVSVSSNNGMIEIVIDGKRLDLAALAKAPPAPRPNTLWLRAVRAVALLESFGTPAARSVLNTLARGEPGAAPTQEAKAALARLAEVKKP
jgi:RNA polymerase sigma factor (sigma-70 family)